jgi:hypothetical protein
MTVEYPLTENYDRPLDADQFGTTSDLPQGDGYLDSHCIEVHGLPEDGTVEYGEAQIDGEHADQIEVVGYIQQAHEAWDTDTDPIDDAESYEEAGGGWTYETDASHGQVVVVLQLDAAEKTVPDDEDDEGTDDADAGDEPTDTTDEANESDEETDHDRDKDEGDVLQRDPPEETTSGDNTKDGAGPDDADAGDEPADITDEADANDEMDREKGEVNVMGNSDDDSILAFGVLVTVGMLFLTALARARLSRSPIRD